MSVFQTHVNFNASYASSDCDGRTSPTASIHTSSDASTPSTPPSRPQYDAIGTTKKSAPKSTNGQPGRGDPWKRLRYYSRSSATPAVTGTGALSRSDSTSSMNSAVPQPSFLKETPVPLPSFMMPKPAEAQRTCGCPHNDTVHQSPLVAWAHSSRPSVV